VRLADCLPDRNGTVALREKRAGGTAVRKICASFANWVADDLESAFPGMLDARAQETGAPRGCSIWIVWIGRGGSLIGHDLVNGLIQGGDLSGKTCTRESW